MMSSLISVRGWWCALLGAAVVQLMDAAQLTPAEAELAKRFAGVTQWQGIYEVSVIGSATISSASGNHLESRYEASGHGTFTLERDLEEGWEPETGFFMWKGKGGARGGGIGTFSEWNQRGVGEEWSQEFGGAVRQERIEFSLGIKNKSALLHPGIQRGEPVMRRVGRMASAQGNGVEVSPIDTTFPAPLDVWYLGSTDADKARRWQAVGNGPGVITFTFESPTAGRSQKFQVSGAGVVQRSKVILYPVYEDLEVQVTIADYATWRPRGSIADPKKPGNSLVARATLKSKSAKPVPPIKEFRFDLLDTSREPGVCLNWPLGAKDDDYDLRLAVAGTGGDLSKSDQKLTITSAPTNPQRQPYAEAAVQCFDFGARAELRVICELRDGREIIGLLKDESGEQDLIRLPKMKGPDWIADAWRREKDVLKLAAGDDSEKVEGHKHDGDGYTLYEEYRGWAVNGRHVEGDPKRKDFFVQDLGADAQPGIALFQALSKLRVHSKLRRSEMSQSTRLMNGNHRDAPHRVNQHGVWVKNFTRDKLGDNGADTPMTKAGVAGRPGIAKGVGLLARHDAESLFNQPFNLPARDTIFAYDRAIAHELLHSVGVEHHGPTDKTGYALKFIPPNVPENKIGRPHYQTGDGTPFTVLQENGHDLAASVYVHYAETTAKFGSAMMDMLVALWSSGPAGSSDPAEARRRAEASLRGAFDQVYEQRGLVGLEHGEHSGDQDCVMRYYFARFYESKGRKDTLYVIAPGTERIGIDICHAATGTGINAPAHQPQSRYGNAAPGEGDCFSQICPNDAIPPRKTKS